MRKSILVCGLITALSGCSTTGTSAVPQKPDPIELKILEAAKDIQKKTNQIYAVEAARQFEISGANDNSFDLSLLPGLQQVVSLGSPWDGPLDKFLIKLSAAAALNAPRFLDIKPSGGVVVSVDTDYRRVIDMLEDATTQAGSKVKVTIKVKERLLEVQYLGL